MTQFKLFTLMLIFAIEVFDLPVLKSYLFSKLKISPETTVFLGPLKPDGTVDYEAVFNEKASAGVAPDENAVVLLDRAFGCHELPEALRPRFYHYLGVESPPSTGRRLIGQDLFIQQLVDKALIPAEDVQNIQNQIAHATSRLWTRSEFPHVAAWIDANQEPIQLLEQASLRRRFYLPLVVGNGKFEDATIPIVQKLAVQGMRLVRARAMLRLSDRNFEAAVNDLMINQRMSRLVGQYPMSICDLYGVAIDADGVANIQVLLAQDLNVEQVDRYQKLFLSLPKVTDFTAAFDLADRIIAHEILLGILRDKTVPKTPGQSVRYLWIDINDAMRRCNAYYDTLIRAHRTAGLRDRKRAIAAVQSEMIRRKEAVQQTNASWRRYLQSRQALTRMVADIAIAVSAPAADRLQMAQDRSEMREDLLRVGFAMAAYRAKRGHYPHRLDQLVPQFLGQLPVDQYNDQPLHYHEAGRWYRIYSVGDNEQDDGGKPFDAVGGDLTFEVVHNEAQFESQGLERIRRDIAERKRVETEFQLQVLSIFLSLFAIWGVWRAVVWFPNSKLKVGPEWSVVDGPLKDDGTLDFEVALNASLSAESTEQNNAAVPLAQAFGPAKIPSQLRSRYYGYLKTPELPLAGSYFIDEDQYARTILSNTNATDETFESIVEGLAQNGTRPWNRDEFPYLAGWIDVNQEPLKLIELASQKSTLYSPVVNDGALWEAPIPILEPLGSVVRLLTARTMLKVSAADLTGAINDLLICYRLAGLLSQFPHAAGNMVGISVDAIAHYCSQVILAQPLTKQQIEAFRSALATIAEAPDIVVTLNGRARLEMLDGLQRSAINPKVRQDLLGFQRFSKFDVNLAARRANKYFDSLTAILKTPDLQQRTELLNASVCEMESRVKRAKVRLGFIRRLAWRSKPGFSNAITDTILGLMGPDVRHLNTVRPAASTSRRILSVALALAAYHQENGTYPEQLLSLIPDFLDAIPLNDRSLESFFYQLLPSGYLLSSAATDGDGDQNLAFQVRHLD